MPKFTNKFKVGDRVKFKSPVCNDIPGVFTISIAKEAGQDAYMLCGFDYELDSESLVYQYEIEPVVAIEGFEV